MVRKTITIAEDAYNRLNALKRRDESFSDLIDRLTRPSVDRMVFAGSCPGLGGHVEETRDEFDRDPHRSGNESVKR